MKNTSKSRLIACLLMVITNISMAQAPPTEVKTLPNKVGAAVINATTTEVKIDLEPVMDALCPTKVERGDREFGGHGPRIKSEVKIRLANNGTEIWADVTFWAQETVPDNSTTSGQWSRKVYDAPYGKKITKIVSEQASRTAFLSPPAGAQFLVAGQNVNEVLKSFFEGIDIPKKIKDIHGITTANDLAKLISSYNNGNTVMKVSATEGTLVRFFHIVGDTGGDDISNDDNCNDDTRIEKIEFFPLKVMMTNR